MFPLDPTPLLQPRYRPSQLLLIGPPQHSPASVRSPYGLCHLCFSLGIGTSGSRSSARKPELDSRLLYAGRRLSSNQVPYRLITGNENVPDFDDKLLCYDASTEVQFCSSSQFLPARGIPRRFDSNAHYRRLLTAAAWSGLKSALGNRLRRAYLHLPCS